MTEPITTNKYLIAPLTGDLSGTWGTAALNPNFTIIDAMFGGVTTISLSSTTTILLTVPATTGIWAGTVPQSSNSLIRFTGAQTGSATISFTLPGFYIIENLCTGTTFIKLQPATGGGSTIGAIPGRKIQVFFDGTNMDYVNVLPPGTAWDYQGSAAPTWFSACSLQPYLYKDGTVYNISTYTALGAILGSTYGGNGVTTFAVPDERARVRAGYDQAGTGRLTAVINGGVFNSAGGSQYMQAHDHGAVTTAGGVDHTHGYNDLQPVAASPGAAATDPVGISIVDTPRTTGGASAYSHTHGIVASGAGTSENIQPTIVSMIPYIKT